MKLIFTALCLALFYAPVELQKRSLLEGKVEILVPVEFTEMSEEMLNVKYRGQNKPTYVLSDSDGTVNLAFNLTNNKANENLIASYQASLKSSLASGHPMATWKGDGIKSVNDKKVGYFKLITQASDQKVYNYIFIANVEGKLLIGTFNCIEKLMPEWEALAEKIVSSLRVK